MNVFKIIIALDKNLFNEKLEKRVQYMVGKYDTVSFENNNIIIEGQRSNRINHVTCLKTVKSNYYRLIIIALLYTYFTKGSFSIKSSKLIVQNSKIQNELEFAIKQRFENGVPAYLVFNEELEGLFCDDMAKVEILIKALSYLNLSVSDKNQKFNNSWKAFNSMLRGFSTKKTDFEQIKELREVMRLKFSEFERVNEMCNNVSYEDLDKCRTNDMLINNFEKNNTKTIQSFLEFINDFNDERVCKLLSEKMKCKRKYIDNFENELEKINIKVDKRIKDNLDIVRFLIFKYAYYLRCKFFHAEKIDAEYLFENEESEELKRISRYIHIIVADMIRNLESSPSQ